MNPARRNPDCPLCPSNGLLKEGVIAQNNGAYLINAHSSPGNFLIIPQEHIESPLDLPDSWWQSVKALLPGVPGLGEHYNISVNVGQRAGQTVKHLHLWLIPRPDNQLATGKGLARLISETNTNSA